MLTPVQAAIAKGMRARGEFNHHIAAWLDTNQGRPAELNTGEEYPNIQPALPQCLPPRGTPVGHLRYAVTTMRTLQTMIHQGRSTEELRPAIEEFLSNVTGGTNFFDGQGFL
ncbi:hypothetical protein [Azospirillum canadense]|uniref:hypothetical protein n=1 Tax=Azospirillum canadense TaxID=403962 RepID=UPI0022267D02|nr:hypothetical protein [Azospirillum canadense]MCW2236754.1 hypothetical protein [Azospirillum canadense]